MLVKLLLIVIFFTFSLFALTQNKTLPIKKNKVKASKTADTTVKPIKNCESFYERVE